MQPQNYFKEEVLTNCNASLFTKLPGPEYSEEKFRSSIQAATTSPACPHGGDFTIFCLMLNVNQESCDYNFL